MGEKMSGKDWLNSWVSDLKDNFVEKSLENSLNKFIGNLTNMVTKLGQFTKLGPFSVLQLFKLSNLCYHFLSSFEYENIFFDIPSDPSPIAARNSWTNHFTKKKWRFCILSTDKKVQNWNVEKGTGKTCHFFSFLFLIYIYKYTKTSNYLMKFIGQWIPDGDGQEIAKDMKKIFSFSKCYKKW